MDTEVNFRQVKASDFDALADIISDTWNYKDLCSKKTAHRMGLLYLAGCLCDQTFTQVAVKDGRPVGVIMGNDVKHCKIPLKYKLMYLKNSFLLLLSEEGRFVKNMFGNFEDNMDSRLLEESGRNFDGELSFFAVSEEMRGSGVGDKLYKMLMEYFRKQNIDNFYLFTDTTCNYGFYVHKGIKKVNEKKADFSKFRLKDQTFFLFAKDSL